METVCEIAVNGKNNTDLFKHFSHGFSSIVFSGLFL